MTPSNLLVVAATEIEIGKFSHFIQSTIFPVEILITGVGMVETAYNLGNQLAHRHYDLILNAGIAGSFKKQLAPGTIVRVVSDIFSELGAENGTDFISFDQLGFGTSIFKERSTSVQNLKSILEIPSTTGVTVNTVHGDAPSIDNVLKRLNPDVESMEGAAVFYSAQKSGTNCLQIRSISNYIEKRNRENWQIELAVNNLNNWLITFIEELFDNNSTTNI